MAKKTGKLLRLQSAHLELLAALMLMHLQKQVCIWHPKFCSLPPCTHHAMHVLSYPQYTVAQTKQGMYILAFHVYFVNISDQATVGLNHPNGVADGACLHFTLLLLALLRPALTQGCFHAICVVTVKGGLSQMHACSSRQRCIWDGIALHVGLCCVWHVRLH